mmetsp:Transcript_71096/g.200667  ORF Transcript_71096/g.200667 Transcript_71096/m.200667 type:complete len:308 (-) Transcript_71096:43-966(-)
MASSRNDALAERAAGGGSVNYYDNHASRCTSQEKGLAARLGGHTYNIINNRGRDEIYLNGSRSDDHYVDKQGCHTVHCFGARRRKFAGDERDLVRQSMWAPDAHPREHAVASRRTELQLTQIENSQSYGAFQRRCQESISAPPPPKRYSIDNAKYAGESQPLRPKVVAKDEWSQRRGERMSHSASAPSFVLSDPAASLARAARSDAWLEVSQRQTESAHFAPTYSANTCAGSMDTTDLGKQMASGQARLSVNRMDNHDFSVTRKNNHYSSGDKLTRSDPFYMRPRPSITNNSVKYNIVNNERRWFKY